MAQKTTYYCDGCGKEKGETNHWWVIYSEVSMELIPFRVEAKSGMGTESKIYCGQACVTAAVSKYMDRQVKKAELPCVS